MVEGLGTRGLGLGLLVWACLAGSVTAQQPTPTDAPAANHADVASVDAIIKVLYDVISGPAGQKRDWDRFRSLFAPGARLIPTRQRPNEPAAAVVLDPEGYIQRSAPLLEERGFFEREVFRKTESFGRITHIFSTYSSFHTAADTAPFSRGINSIQLLNDGTRWWIVTIYWDAERPGLTLPPEYLPPSRR